MKAFTVLAWLVALVWFVNSWINHELYYESLIAFFLVSASLLGFFLPKDKGSNSEGEDERSQLNNEMELLIAPLYAKMNRNNYIMSFMSTFLTSRRFSFTDIQERDELENLETEIRKIMRQYGHLASEQLYFEINKFLNLEPKYNQDKHNEAYSTLIEIKNLVKLRHDQLRIELA